MLRQLEKYLKKINNDTNECFDNCSLSNNTLEIEGKCYNYCPNIKCEKCSKESLFFHNLCLSCNNDKGYYPI